jgi:hypothetical protein
MIATRNRIGTLFTTVQDEFLDTPGLRLTLNEAATRFGFDETMCQALLDVLLQAGVLTKARDGRYVRYFPPRIPSRSAAVLRHPGRRARASGRAPQAA